MLLGFKEQGAAGTQPLLIGLLNRPDARGQKQKRETALKGEASEGMIMRRRCGPTGWWEGRVPCRGLMAGRCAARFSDWETCLW